jgi:hypothetical protein
MATVIFKRKRNVAMLVALAGLAWAILIGLLFIFNIGNYDFWFPGRVLAYVLLLVAPALTFVPVGRGLQAGWYGWLATVAWAYFGFVLAFTRPDLSQGWRDNVNMIIVFLIGLGLVAYSLSWPIFYRLGFKIFRKRIARYDMVRSHREALLLSVFIMAIFFLGALRLLSATYAIALFLMFMAVELLFLSRGFKNS